MGIIDAFKEEDRVTVTVSQLYKMLREAAKTELLMNAVRCDVPNRHIAAMADGKYPEIIYGELPDDEEKIAEEEGGEQE